MVLHHNPSDSRPLSVREGGSVAKKQEREKRNWREIVGKERLYNDAFTDREDVVLWDVLSVRDGEKLKLLFESKNSEWEQGVWLMCDKGLTVERQTGKSVYLWYDHSPPEVVFICHTQEGLLSIYNVWDRGRGPESQSHSSGMLVEERSNGRQYCCNDIGFDTKFDKLVFRIERVESKGKGQSNWCDMAHQSDGSARANSG
jgi:hypothetical protein